MKIERELTAEEKFQLIELSKATVFNYAEIENIYRRMGTIANTERICFHSTMLNIQPVFMVTIIESYGKG